MLGASKPHVSSCSFAERRSARAPYLRPAVSRRRDRQGGGSSTAEWSWGSRATTSRAAGTAAKGGLPREYTNRRRHSPLLTESRILVAHDNAGRPRHVVRGPSRTSTAGRGSPLRHAGRKRPCHAADGTTRAPAGCCAALAKGISRSNSRRASASWCPPSQRCCLLRGRVPHAVRQAPPGVPFRASPLTRCPFGSAFLPSSRDACTPP